MPGYIGAALTRFQHKQPSKLQHQPFPHVPPKYAVHTQYPLPEDTSPPATTQDKKFIQQVTWTLLYYAWAINNTILTALSTITAEQAAPIQWMLQNTKQLLNFAATQGNTIIVYNTSNVGPQHPKQEAKPRDTFFYQQMKNFPTAMVPSTTLQKSSEPSCRPLQRLNLEHYCNASNINRNGTQITTDANSNRQLKHPQHHHKHHSP